MRSSGFDFEAASGSNDHSENKLFAATTLNVTTALADDLSSAGCGKLQVGDLFKASQMGFDKEPFESLVKMRIFKVTPEFITEVRNEGLTDTSVEDLVKLRIFKIDSDLFGKQRLKACRSKLKNWCKGGSASRAIS